MKPTKQAAGPGAERERGVKPTTQAAGPGAERERGVKPTTQAAGPGAEDVDFAALMQREGVTRVKETRAAMRSPTRRAEGPTRAVATRGDGRGEAAARGDVPRGEVMSRGEVVARGEVMSRGEVVARGGAPRGELMSRGEVVARGGVPRELMTRGGAPRGEVIGRGEDGTGVRAPAAVEPARGGEAIEARLTALRAERDALVVRVEGLERERDAALDRLNALQDSRRAELEAVQARSASLRAELAAARAVVTAPRTTLAQALTGRGVLGAAEQSRALAVLAGTESAARLLEALEVGDVASVTSALERRLALVCGDPGCAPELGAAALMVERARCEVCGGSDIRRAAHGFVRACAAAGISRVRFVGGSPNYRTRLAALFPDGGPLTVRTTAGDQRVRLNRSKLQQRGDDLVIVWGASELDHATSGVYRAEHGRTEVIAHRGIGRMLELASERVSAG